MATILDGKALAAKCKEAVKAEDKPVKKVAKKTAAKEMEQILSDSVNKEE